MRVVTLENFISEEEANILNNFAIESIKNEAFKEGKFSKPVNPPNTQMVSRFNPNIVFPKEALHIKGRIQTLLGVSLKDTHTLNHASSIVVNCSFKGASVIEHVDPRQDDKALLRCNILTSVSEKGGDFYLGGQVVDTPKNSIYCCLVSEYQHSVTVVEGDTPRIVWQFGFNVNKDDWDSGKIKVQYDSRK